MIANMKAKGIVNVSPIYDWTDDDVWKYLMDNNFPHNPLYDKGYKRVGCIGCPLGGRKSMLKEFADYPIYKKNYIRTFDRMLKKRIAKGKDDITGKEGYHIWKTGQDVFNWWIMEGDVNVYGQMTIEDMMKDGE